VVRASNNCSYDLTALNDPNPQSRADAIIALGRSRDRQAVAPITRALREDGSPIVRESAARALGLIGMTASLDALQRAAQADPDRDVRKSASFAADVIRANVRR
jgi:epoxyqueuosine reductase